MYDGEKEVLLEELRKLRGNDCDDSEVVVSTEMDSAEGNSSTAETLLKNYKYYKKNKEKILEKRKAYYEKNKETIKEKARKAYLLKSGKPIMYCLNCRAERNVTYGRTKCEYNGKSFIRNTCICNKCGMDLISEELEKEKYALKLEKQREAIRNYYKNKKRGLGGI